MLIYAYHFYILRKNVKNEIYGYFNDVFKYLDGMIFDSQVLQVSWWQRSWQSSPGRGMLSSWQSRWHCLPPEVAFVTQVSAQYVFTIDPSVKSHNAPVLYPTKHHFVTEMCTHVHSSCYKVVYYAIFVWCIVGFVWWDYYSDVTHNRHGISHHRQLDCLSNSNAESVSYIAWCHYAIQLILQKYVHIYCEYVDIYRVWSVTHRGLMYLIYDGLAWVMPRCPFDAKPLTDFIIS